MSYKLLWIFLIVLQVVRIGHPARLVESVLRYSLDALLSACDSAQIMEDVTKDLEKALVSECVCVHMCVWCVHVCVCLCVCPCGVCIYACVCVWRESG